MILLQNVSSRSLVTGRLLNGTFSPLFFSLGGLVNECGSFEVESLFASKEARSGVVHGSFVSVKHHLSFSHFIPCYLLLIGYCTNTSSLLGAIDLGRVFLHGG